MVRLGKSHYTVDDFNFSFGLSQSESRRIKRQQMKRSTGRKGRGSRGSRTSRIPKESASNQTLKTQFVNKINHDLKVLGSRQSLPAPPNRISYAYAKSYVRGAYREDINLIEAIQKGNGTVEHSKINTKGINLSEYWYGYMRPHINFLIDEAIKDNQTFVGFSRRFRQIIKEVIDYSYNNNKPAYNIVKYVLFG
jgi:hypothetical protein